MKRLLAVALLALAPVNAPLADTPMAAPAAARDPKTLHYLDPAEFAPAHLLPAPPAPGSAAETYELAYVKAMIAAASPERLRQAAWDSDNEDPAVFNGVLGFDLRTLPHTWALLSTIQDEADVAAGMGKVFFARNRPYAIDETVPVCGGRPARITPRSYPSGHASLGYSVGYALARLIPAKSATILARASEYAESREFCGVHFPSDTEASHVLGTLAAARLLDDPRLADQVAAARAELAGH